MPEPERIRLAARLRDAGSSFSVEGTYIYNQQQRYINSDYLFELGKDFMRTFL